MRFSSSSSALWRATSPRSSELDARTPASAPPASSPSPSARTTHQPPALLPTLAARTHPPSWAARRPTSRRRRRRRPRPQRQPAPRPAQPEAVRVAHTQPRRSTQHKKRANARREGHAKRIIRPCKTSEHAVCSYLVRVRVVGGGGCFIVAAVVVATAAQVLERAVQELIHADVRGATLLGRQGGVRVRSCARRERSPLCVSAHTRAGTRDAAATFAHALQAACRAGARHAVASRPREAAEASGGCACRGLRGVQRARETPFRSRAPCEAHPGGRTLSFAVLAALHRLLRLDLHVLVLLAQLQHARQLLLRELQRRPREPLLRPHVGWTRLTRPWRGRGG